MELKKYPIFYNTVVIDELIKNDEDLLRIVQISKLENLSIPMQYFIQDTYEKLLKVKIVIEEQIRNLTQERQNIYKEF